MSLKSTKSSTPSQYVVDSAEHVEARPLESSTPTVPTLESLITESLSRAKAGSPQPTGPSLLLSDPSIPNWNYDCSSKQITTPPSYTSKDIPSGPKSMDSNGAWETSSQPSGSTKALTYDGGKAPLANIPWAAVEQMSIVQLYGHTKYKDFNNYRKGMEVTRNLSCALRHIKDYLEGHDTDPESSVSPLAHAMCRVAFVLQNIHDGTAIDDRYKSHAN